MSVAARDIDLWDLRVGVGWTTFFCRLRCGFFAGVGSVMGGRQAGHRRQHRTSPTDA